MNNNYQLSDTVLDRPYCIAWLVGCKERKENEKHFCSVRAAGVENCTLRSWPTHMMDSCFYCDKGK